MRSISTATWLSLATGWLAAAAAIAVVAAAPDDTSSLLPVPSQAQPPAPLQAGFVGPERDLITLTIASPR